MGFIFSTTLKHNTHILMKFDHNKTDVIFIYCRVTFLGFDVFDVFNTGNPPVVESPLKTFVTFVLPYAFFTRRILLAPLKAYYFPSFILSEYFMRIHTSTCRIIPSHFLIQFRIFVLKRVHKVFHTI